jgi:large subunit ribosomal protein L21
MRYAIVESGGKQYKAVEGQTIEVDRLPDEEGTQIDLQRILFMADGDEFMIGTPTVSGIEIKATVVDHISGRKVTHFRYRPKKRIRVRGGHRAQYTRLMVDFIGRQGETRKRETVETKAPQAEPVPKISEKKQTRAAAAPAPRKSAEKTASKKSTTKTASKPAAKKSSK